MILAMALLVRDEADIVAQNIRFHLAQGVDRIIVTDNGSIDGTRDILADFERQDVLKLIDEPGRDYSQWRWMTRMAHIARDDMGADWLLPNDADEFWWNGGKSLKDAITKETEGSNVSIMKCQRLNMFYGRDCPSNTLWNRGIIFRHSSPVPPECLRDFMNDPRNHPHFFSYRLPGKVLLRSRGLKTIHQGNHGADYDIDVSQTDTAIRIYHFPVRSLNQFASKSCNGGSAYARNTHLPNSTGWHKRRWYNLYLTQGAHAAINDALPSCARLQTDLASGDVIKDKSIVEALDQAK